MSNNPWPMFLQNGRHTGLSAQVGPFAAEAAWTYTAPLPITTGVAVAADGTVYFGCQDNKLYALNPDQTVKWTHDTGAPFAYVTPAIDADGTVYIGNRKLHAITAAGALKWAFEEVGTIAASPTLGDDGTVYVVSQDAATPANNRLLALTAAGALKWAFPLGGVSYSTPAIGADGTVYCGCDNHLLYAVKADGQANWSYDAGGPVRSAPVVGSDGTVYCVATPAPATPPVPGTPAPPAQHRLLALDAAGTLKWQYDYEGDAATPALAPDGTIYLAYRTFKLAAINPGGTQKWAVTAANPAVTPGAPAVAADGSVYFATQEGACYAYNADGTPRWTAGGGTGSAAPAIGAGGNIYVGALTRTLTAMQGPLTPALQALYTRLQSARRPVPDTAQFTYPLNATSLGDAALTSLITGNLGVQELQVTGAGSAVAISTRRLVLTGTATFLNTPATPVTITFVDNNGTLTMSLAALPPAGWSFGTCFADLQPTYFDQLAGQITSPAFFLSSTEYPDATRAVTVPAGLSFYGQTALGGPLAQLPALLGSRQPLTLFGPITFQQGKPILALQLGNTYTIRPVESLTMTARVTLQTSYNARYRAIATAINLEAQLPFGTARTLTITGNVPTAPGLVMITGTFEPAWDAGLSALNLWGGSEDLKGYLPEQLQATPTFGLSTVRLGYATNTGAFPSLEFIFTAPDWNAIDGAFAVTGVAVELSVINPFSSQRRFEAVLRGNSTLTAGASSSTFQVVAQYPDYSLSANLIAGSVDPAAIAASLVRTTLPAGMPTMAFDEVHLAVYPKLGRISYYMRSSQLLPIPVGIEGFGLTGLGMTLDRVQVSPGGSYTWTCSLFGVVALANSGFQVVALNPLSGSDWQFRVRLTADLPLPSIGEIVGYLNAAWAGALPGSIADLGHNIVLKQLDASVTQASKELAVTVGSPSGWAGWPVVTEPVALTISRADVAVKLASGQSPTGAVKGTFLLAGKPIALAVPLPFNSGTFTLALDTGSQGLDLPTVGQLVGYINQTWADAMPDFIKGLGSGITLNAFAVAVSPAQTAVTVDMSAAPSTAPWNLITQPVTIGLVNLRVAVSATRKSGATTLAGAIKGSVKAGSRTVPLKVPFSDNFNTFTLALDTDQGVPLPTVGDIVSLANPSWAAALPDAISGLGSNISLKDFSLAVSPQTRKLTVDVGTPQNFAGWTLVEGLGLTIKAADVLLVVEQPAGGAATASGKVQGDMTLCDQTVQMILTLPEAELKGHIGTPGFNLKKLVQLFFGSSAEFPGFLENVGFLATDVVVAFKAPSRLTVSCLLARDITVPGAGTLKKLSLDAEYVQGGAARICLVGEWHTTAGAVIPGRLCYPFKKWGPKPGEPNFEPIDFPPPDVPPSKPIDYDTGVKLVLALLGAGVAVLGCAAILALAYGVGPEAIAAMLVGANASLPSVASALATFFRLSPEVVAKYLFSATKGGATPAGIFGALTSAFGSSMTVSTAAAALLGVFTLGAGALAAVLATGFGAPKVAPVLRQRYPQDTDTPLKMANLLREAYGAQAVSAAEMAASLAAGGYPAADAAPVLRSLYPADTDTAAKLSALLLAAYTNPPLTSAALTGILQAAGFNLLDVARVVVPQFASVPLNQLAQELVQAYQATAPASALQLGIALAAAGVSNPSTLAPAVRAALPATTAMQMAIVLQVAYADSLAAALTLAQARRQAGETPVQAATAVMQAHPTLTANTLTGVLTSVFTPPPLTLPALAGALVTGFGPAQITPGTVALALQAGQAPAAVDATAIAQALVAGYTGPLSLTATQVAQALKDAGYPREQAAAALTAAGFSAEATAAAIAAVYGSTALSLAGGNGYVLVPDNPAYSFGGQGDFTLVARVKGSGGVVLLRQGAASQHGAGFQLSVTPQGIVSLSTTDASGNNQTYASIDATPEADGNWHWIAAVRRSAGGVCSFGLFVDGQACSGFQPGSPALDITVGAPLYIGSPGAAVGAESSFNGLVMQVALWNTALSPEQLAAYTPPTGPATGLVGCWPFTENSAGDVSALHNGGSVQGGAALIPQS